MLSFITFDRSGANKYFDNLKVRTGMSSWPNNMVNCSILKWLLSKYNTWLIFYSDIVTTISEASCRAFQYEKFLFRIWKQTWIISFELS